MCFLTENDNHFVIYGNNYMKSYHYMLENMKILSPSNLSFSRKTTIETSNQNIVLPMSDIHLEIDFELLGVNEYALFFEIYHHLTENIVLNKKKLLVVCLHFDQIKKELMEVFYNFLNNDRVVFVFIVKDICYMHPYILKKSVIKKCKNNDSSNSSVQFHSKIDAMIPHIIHENQWSFFQWREKLYELLILNYNIHDCFSYLIECLVKQDYLNYMNIDVFFSKYTDILEKYNNNYRTIYHLERFILLIRNLKK